MWQRTGNRDAPVNNLMVRSQLAGSFQVPGIADTPPRAGGVAAFSWLFHDREDFTTFFDIKPFVIMESYAELLTARTRINYQNLT
jgi:hypothetical protein